MHSSTQQLLPLLVLLQERVAFFVVDGRKPGSPLGCRHCSWRPCAAAPQGGLVSFSFSLMARAGKAWRCYLLKEIVMWEQSFSLLLDQQSAGLPLPLLFIPPWKPFGVLFLYLSHTTDAFLIGNKMYLCPFFCANSICKEK